MDYFDLTGQVAVVTGASAGLGVQMACALASKGANLVLLARRQNLLDEKAAYITQKYGVKVLPLSCDITDTARIKEAVRLTISTFGRVDILVNNAGTGTTAPTLEITDEQFENEIKIDLFGTFACSREFGEEMLKRRYGRIINISSMYGLVGNMAATCSPYHAAKGGVVNLTRALAAEWGRSGVTVNCICPGYFHTDLTKDLLETEWFQQYARRAIPVGRYGVEGELDTCVLFLASPHSRYITGQSIAIDGGYTSI
ncbi:MAG: SDR family oxidoreductase [Clostridia bacterium]|nr:SDR family oxidoreductase [Clostridia bacterium]